MRSVSGFLVASFLMALPPPGGAAEAEPAPTASVEPIDPAERGRLADLLFRTGRFKEAIGEYREWLRLHPDDASRHNRLGVCLQKAGDSKAARREYERAIKIDSCYAEAWNNLASLEHVRGKLSKAVSAYAKAVQCKPEVAVFHRNLGSAYMDTGDLVRSALEYGEALRLDPTVLDTVSGLEISVNTMAAGKRYFALAKVCAKRDDLEAALRFLRRARACGLENFAQAVAAEPAFAEMLAIPRYAELLQQP
jgi:Flp pilus assembly protein TadD